MTDLEVPPRTEPTTLPAPTMDLVADRAPLPPPPLRVPAVAPTMLPLLNGPPVVPPMPRFSLDDLDGTSVAEAGPTVDIAADDIQQAADLSCPASVEPAPASILVAEVVPTRMVTETTETPVVEASQHVLASDVPSLASVAPSLPTVTAPPTPTSAPTVPVSHHPTQAGLAPVTSLADALAAPAPAVRTSGGGFGRAVARTVFAIVLVGAAGAGAHLGYDWWEGREAAAIAGASVDGTELAAWPQVDPPAIRYADSVTVFRDVSGVRTLTTHREIASGWTQATVGTTDAAGAETGIVEIDHRDEQSFVKATPDSPWLLTPGADALEQIGDTWTTDVFTVSEMFPPEILPYTTVLESVERALPVRPLVPAMSPGSPVETPMATSTDPTSMVWQYRVIIDVESFRSNETAAHQAWTRRLGRNAVSRIEASIDATGIVRQFAVESNGAVITHTLVGGSANSDRFEANPLLEPGAPLAPVTPESTPAPEEAAG